MILRKFSDGVGWMGALRCGLFLGCREPCQNGMPLST